MKKYLKYLPLVLSLLLILFLNLQDKEASMSLSNSIASLFIDNTFIYTHIRKLGHVVEYFILSICTYIAFNKKSLIADASVSLLDQLLKALLPVRHFDMTDIPYDMVGYLIGFIICIVVDRLFFKRRIKNI